MPLAYFGDQVHDAAGRVGVTHRALDIVRSTKSNTDTVNAYSP